MQFIIQPKEIVKHFEFINLEFIGNWKLINWIF